MTPDEEWRPVVGYEGAYEVSSLGRVRSLDRQVYAGGNRSRLARGRVLAGSVNAVGYRAVHIETTRLVHHLIAEAFIDPRPTAHHVRHLNGDRLDNRVANLAYGTVSENNLDMVRHGTHYESTRTHCPSGHPYDAANTILYRGRRYCRACKRRHQLDSYYRKRAAA